MKAKILVYALPALILATIHLAEAQQPKKVPQIGFLVVPSRAFFANRIESFEQGLHSLGSWKHCGNTYCQVLRF